MTISVELRAWALRHSVGEDALAELVATIAPPPAGGEQGSESRVQSHVRLAAPSLDMRLFRNNVGVLKDETGRPVRYGLANDSAALNKRLKSSDLIGWRRLEITACMVGAHVAQFVAIETKRPDWTYRGDEREQAQQRFGALVLADGGYFRFATGPESLT